MNPRDPQIESIDGDNYQLSQEFPAWLGLWVGDWLAEIDFIIPAGEPTDIASVPRWFRGFYDRASLGVLAPVVHDKLCALEGRITNACGQRKQLTWMQVHVSFLLLMWMDGIDERRAFLAFAAVMLRATVFHTPRWELDPTWTQSDIPD
jgi:Protein of unknown function (DUF1353)